MSPPMRVILTAAAVAVLVLGIAGAVALLRDRDAEGNPGDGTSTQITETVDPSSGSLDPSEYWTDERMDSASPAPMSD